MKKSMIALAMLIATIAKGQFSLQPRIGMNENKRLVFGMDVAYQVGHFEPALSISEVQHTQEAGYFGARLGYVIRTGVNIMPFTGLTFKAQSFDKNEFQTGNNGNKWLINAGVRVEKGPVFLQADYMDQFQLSIGLIVK